MRLLIHLMVTGHYPSRVPPFGNPWLNAYVRLPTAYRSLSRPSSAISAMASTLRSCSLDLALLRPSPPKTVEAGTELIVLSCFPVQFSRCGSKTPMRIGFGIAPAADSLCESSKRYSEKLESFISFRLNASSSLTFFSHPSACASECSILRSRSGCSPVFPAPSHQVPHLSVW